MKKLLPLLALVAMLTLSGYSVADEHAVKSADYMPSLITATPLEGRMLAITIVRKTVGTIQRDGKVKHAVRDIYADDPMMLMRAVELVNLEFAIIAEANNYWRK
ncbi:MAG: hexameric tyrosine-coordinated heme protein [Methylophagaceae bacterium]